MSPYWLRTGAQLLMPNELLVTLAESTAQLEAERQH